MALQELLRALGEQAAERRANELSRAMETAGRIREESRGARARRRQEFLSRVKEEEEETARRAISLAQSESMRNVLTARDRLLDRVREGVVARLTAAASDPVYLDVLSAEVRAALERLPAEAVSVTVVPALVSHVEKALAGVALVCVEASDDVGPGFRALSHDGGMEVDGTLGSRLDRAWPRLAVSVIAEVAP